MIVSTYLVNEKFGGFRSEENIPEGYLIAVTEYPIDLIDGYYNADLNEWYENASVEELNKIILELENKIIEKYNYLMMRALSSSMGKNGSYEYLQNQKSEYDEKYLVSKGEKISIPLSSSLEKEMNRDFTEASLIATLEYFGITPEPTKLEMFYQLIIFKYEYAENRYEIFKAFCVDYRTKCRTFLELDQLDKLNQAFAMADLPDTLTDEQIETLYNQFDTL